MKAGAGVGEDELIGAGGEPSSEDSQPRLAGWAATFRAGDVVARRYRVVRFIARGGMGEVYEAFDGDLSARVALKTVLSTVCDDPRAVRRLKAEVQLAHRVSHENVCRIYDLGVHSFDGGRGVVHFLTMEYIEGERLSERIARGRLTPSESLDVARRLLNGLRAAHTAGILHRDFKSDNVMLRPSPGGRTTPVIMDFGLARRLEDDAARLSGNGLSGTPCYMAPEQLEGQPLTIASDIYSFGVVWFETLTAQLPFSPRTPFDRLLRPARSAAALNADVPAAIDGILRRCLERQKSKRFASADQVLVALQELEPRDGRASGVLPRPSRRLTVKSAGIALLGVACVSAFGASRGFQRAAPPTVHPARSGPTNAPPALARDPLHGEIAPAGRPGDPAPNPEDTVRATPAGAAPKAQLTAGARRRRDGTRPATPSKTSTPPNQGNAPETSPTKSSEVSPEPSSSVATPTATELPLVRAPALAPTARAKRRFDEYGFVRPFD